MAAKRNSRTGTPKSAKFAKAARAAGTAGAAAAVNELAGKIGAFATSLGDQPSTKQVKESAQQIWLAGLGAFSRAQDEGKKMFEALVKQGEQIEQRSRHLAEATMETAREQASRTVEMAAGKFDKLEQVFENRVHSSLNRLGVLTSKDVEALSAQVSELSQAVRSLLAQEKGGKQAAARKLTAAKKPAARKPAAKKTAAKAKPRTRRA